MSNDTEKKNMGKPDEISGLTADFVCFVCGAVFVTDEDRKSHLEKESHGKLDNDVTKEERRKASEQEKINEARTHRI